MKPNVKVAPVSCYCKLNELVFHLKRMVGQQAGDALKRKAVLASPAASHLFKRYI